MQVGWRLRAVLAGCVFGVLICASAAASYGEPKPRAAIKTPIPHLLEDWVIATSPKGSEADARTIAEQSRATVRTLKDPFTPLAALTCTERASRKPPERVVWEEGDGKNGLMALVDLQDEGSTLLLTPKPTANFLSDLAPTQLTRLNEVAAAICDGLIVAAREQVPSGRPACEMFVNAPSGLTVGQLHVHIVARTSLSNPVDDAYRRRAGAYIRTLVGGGGCF